MRQGRSVDSASVKSGAACPGGKQFRGDGLAVRADVTNHLSVENHIHIARGDGDAIDDLPDAQPDGAFF